MEKIPQVKVSKIAAAAHLINNAYRAAIGEPVRAPYDQLKPEMRASVEMGVVQHLMNENGIPPRTAHELWMTNKLKDGWKYGEKFNEESKTHPCLLPYDALPEPQRVKDYLFSATVQALRNW